MNGAATCATEGDTLRLRGELDFANVVEVKTEGDRWLQGPAPSRCYLDLTDVSRSNSAGIALLLGWLRTARAVNKTLELRNIPAGLWSLMQLSGLDVVLGATVNR